MNKLNEDLAAAVAAIGCKLCAYAPGHGDPEKWPSSRCDCKFGASGNGEQNGCAEMRSVHRMLTKPDSEKPFWLGTLLDAPDVVEAESSPVNTKGPFGV